MERPGAWLVLGATLVTLALGFALKAPCADGRWDDGRQYERLCYSDIVPLYAGRELDRGRIPYLEARNEYPVLTGLAMGAAGMVADSHTGFFVLTAAMLSACALATAWALLRMAGWNALLFALAPTLAMYAYMNWDLIAVALATLGTLAFLRRHDAGAGLLLGLGAAAKLYPALLLLPFALQRIRERRGGAALRMAGAAVVAWAAVNLPFAFLAPERWSEFFRFNTERAADWDSVWLFTQHGLGFPATTKGVNAASAISFVALSAVVWLVARRGRVEPWRLGFPLVALFLLTSKVYSPQFSLWLLPWFALALPDLRLFALFSAAEIAVFVTRFSWFGHFYESGGFPSPAFRWALLARGLVLAACVGVWLRRETRARGEPAAVTA